jgi:hypothetical protein
VRKTIKDNPKVKLIGRGKLNHLTVTLTLILYFNRSSPTRGMNHLALIPC